MSNPLKGEAILTLDGKDYALVFNINAMCEAEEVLGLATPQILLKLANPKRAPLGVVRGLLWGALRAKHPDMTLYDVGTLLDASGGPGAALTAMGKAMSLAFPEASDSPRPRKGAKAGNGLRS